MVLLSEKHPHPKDGQVEFYTTHKEGNHLYGYNKSDPRLAGSIPKKLIKSVTTLIHDQFNEFDAEEVCKHIDLKGKTPEEQIAIWNAYKEECAAKGTAMHEEMCEAHLNGLPVSEKHMQTPEWKQFQQYLKDTDLEPYRTEMRLFHPDLWIAGTADMLFKSKRVGGSSEIHLVLVDWKRSKNLKTVNRYKKFGKPPFDKVPDLNYWHYALQLNIYRVLIQRFYGKFIHPDEMFIVKFHPNNVGYVKLPVPDLTEYVDAMFALRAIEVESLIERLGSGETVEDIVASRKYPDYKTRRVLKRKIEGVEEGAASFTETEETDVEYEERLKRYEVILTKRKIHKKRKSHAEESDLSSTV